MQSHRGSNPVSSCKSQTKVLSRHPIRLQCSLIAVTFRLVLMRSTYNTRARSLHSICAGAVVQLLSHVFVQMCSGAVALWSSCVLVHWCGYGCGIGSVVRWCSSSTAQVCVWISCQAVAHLRSGAVGQWGICVVEHWCARGMCSGAVVQWCRCLAVAQLCSWTVVQLCSGAVVNLCSSSVEMLCSCAATRHVR
jgi:hypothetical protein